MYNKALVDSLSAALMANATLTSTDRTILCLRMLAGLNLSTDLIGYTQPFARNSEWDRCMISLENELLSRPDLELPEALCNGHRETDANYARGRITNLRESFSRACRLALSPGTAEETVDVRGWGSAHNTLSSPDSAPSPARVPQYRTGQTRPLLPSDVLASQTNDSSGLVRQAGRPAGFSIHYRPLIGTPPAESSDEYVDPF